MVATVFLFDIDGVLVQPRGYRAAVRAAVRFLAGQMGLGDDEQIIPDEHILGLFESQGITSEWDMVPICLAVLLDGWQAQHAGHPLPPNLPQAFALASAHRSDKNCPADYSRVILALGAQLQTGEFPADAAQRVSRALFPHLEGHPLLKQVLGDSRDIRRSYTTRLFQHFSLGSRLFEETYGLPAQLESPSLLAVEDRSLLPSALHHRLVEGMRAGQIFAAAYTARPSLPPREIPSPHPDYAPEAEMALNLIGLRDLPAIGFGRLQYLAGETGGNAEDFLKPSPLQALAAIFAALSRQELASLRRAYACLFPLSTAGMAEQKQALGDITPGPPLNLHIFEDSKSGIIAAQRAAQILTAGGWQIDLHAWGITTHAQKRQALQAAGAVLVDSTDQALRNALNGN
jgi:hypothetical protein